MKKNIKITLLVTSILVAFCILSILIRVKEIKDSDAKEIFLNKTLGNIHFKGKVIKFSLISRYSKRYSLACVKLDYTNIDSFYLFKNDYCLVIKNGIATVSGGFFPSDGRVLDYVEVNMNSNTKEIFHYKDGSTLESTYLIGCGGLIETDMNICR